MPSLARFAGSLAAAAPAHNAHDSVFRGLDQNLRGITRLWTRQGVPGGCGF